MVVYQVAKAFGFSISLKPISKDEKPGSQPSEERESFIMPSFIYTTFDNNEDREDDDAIVLLKRAFGDAVKGTEGIRWCLWSDERTEPLLTIVLWDEDYDFKACLFHQSPALLVEVPEFTSARGLATSTDQAEKQPTKKRKVCAE